MVIPRKLFAACTFVLIVVGVVLGSGLVAGVLLGDVGAIA